MNTFSSREALQQWWKSGSTRSSGFRQQAYRSTNKQRHGCLTAYLILVLVVNVIAFSAVPFLISIANLADIDIAPWQYVLGICTVVAETIFVIALFKWKKWGFYGVVASYVVSIIVNTVRGAAAWQIAISVSSLTILCMMVWALEPSAWDQLE